MPKNICVDLNIFLDIVLERSDYQTSRGVIAAGELDQVNLFVSAHEVTTFDYLLRRSRVPLAKRQLLLHWLLKVTTVVATSESLLRQALQSQITDYEDAVVERAAVKAKCDYIVTRNVRDFAASAVPAVSPDAYLRLTK